MKKQTQYIGFRLDEETLALLQALVKQSGKNKKSAVIRTAIQEQAKRILGE